MKLNARRLSKYDGVMNHGLSLYSGDGLPDSVRSEFDLAWDDDFLYLFFSFSGSVGRIAPADSETLGRKTFRLWDLSDVFEAFIACSDRKRYRELQFAPDGRLLDIDIDASGEDRRTDFLWDSGMLYDCSFDGTLWKGRASIPWSAFESGRPSPGDVWFGNFFGIIGEGDGKLFLSWSPVHEINFHRPECFRPIVFSGE